MNTIELCLIMLAHNLCHVKEFLSSSQLRHFQLGLNSEHCVGTTGSLLLHEIRQQNRQCEEMKMKMKVPAYTMLVGGMRLKLVLLHSLQSSGLRSRSVAMAGVTLPELMVSPSSP